MKFFYGPAGMLEKLRRANRKKVQIMRCVKRRILWYYKESAVCFKDATGTIS
jgi:hypothetical protein